MPITYAGGSDIGPQTAVCSLAIRITQDLPFRNKDYLGSIYFLKFNLLMI